MSYFSFPEYLIALCTTDEARVLCLELFCDDVFVATAADLVRVGRALEFAEREAVWAAELVADDADRHGEDWLVVCLAMLCILNAEESVGGMFSVLCIVRTKEKVEAERKGKQFATSDAPQVNGDC